MTRDTAAVVNHLGSIESEAVSIAHLCRFLGMSRRSVEEAVETLRSEGHPIAAGRWGLWIERDPVAYRRNVNRRRNRAIRQLANVRAEMRTVAVLAGQTGAGL